MTRWPDKVFSLQRAVREHVRATRERRFADATRHSRAERHLTDDLRSGGVSEPVCQFDGCDWDASWHKDETLCEAHSYHVWMQWAEDGGWLPGERAREVGE